MNVTAYVFQGFLVLVGVHHSELGPIPVTHRVPLEGVPDGPCDLGAEDQEVPAPLRAAWEQAQDAMHGKLDAELRRAGAEDLVRRTRAGEQNAKATIIEVRKAAEQGNPEAQEAFRVLHDVITGGGGAGEFGADQSVALVAASQKDASDPYRYPVTVAQLLRTDGEHFLASALLLANGPPLDKTRVDAIAQNFGPEVGLFAWGYRLAAEPDRARAFGRGLSPEERRVLSVGRCVGRARAIQGVRREEPLKRLSPRVAWELGE